ncbi:MAG: sigma-70 family RNA polymerase sigma factor [bacterium]
MGKMRFVYSENGSNTLRTYLKEIGQVPLLTPEEEVELAGRIIEDRDEEAFDELVRANLRFVVTVAKKYMNLGLPLADLINEGNMGLIKAARKFDPKRGIRFISYAVWWIRQSIMQAITEQSKTMRIPANRANELYKIEKAFYDLSQDLGREPTSDEVADRLEITLKEVDRILRVTKGQVSLESPIGKNDDGILLDLIADDRNVPQDQGIQTEALREDLESALTSLPQREQRILRMRYGLDEEEPLTLDEIGRRMGLTKERVRQLERRAIKHLRHEARSKRLKAHLN